MKRNSGFSLVEVAVVLVIGGLLIAAFSAYVINFLTQAKIKTTETRIEQVSDALKLYADTNGRLPCVASRVERIDTAAYGREADCAAAAVAGTVRVMNAGKQIRIGMVPTRDINLPDEYGYDAWGSRLVYAVTENQTSNNGYDPANGGIRLIDSAGNPVVNPADGATYIVLSVGSDRKGGFTNAGSQTAACLAGAGLDVENCNDDGIFRQTLISSTRAGANYYDDYLAYAGPVAGGGPAPVTNAFIGSVNIGKPFGYSTGAACKSTSGVASCSCTGPFSANCTISCAKGSPVHVLSVPTTAPDTANPPQGIEIFYACIDNGAPSGSITINVPRNSGHGQR